MAASKENRRSVPSRPEGEAERFDPERDGPELAYEHVHRYALAATALSGLRVLDLGSGSGFGTRLLEEGGCDVTAVDLELGGLAGLRSAALCDARRLPFRNESFDAVVCFEAIEHMEAPERLVSEVARVLRAPAIFLVSTPDREIYTDRAGHKNPFHVEEMTRDEFASLLESRFDTVRLAGQGLWAGSWISDPCDAAGAASNSDDASQLTPAHAREITALTMSPGLRQAELNDKRGDRPSARWALPERSELPVPVYLLGLCSNSKDGASRLEAVLARDSILHDPAQWLLGRYERLSESDTEQNRILEAEIERARLEHLDLASQLDTARSSINQHSREAERARASMRNLETQIEKSRRVIDERHAELLQAEAGAKDVALQLEAARELHDDFRRQLAQAAAAVAAKDDEVKQKVDEKQREFMTAVSTIRELEAEREHARVSAIDFESQIARAREVVDAKDAEIDRARVANEFLAAERERFWVRQGLRLSRLLDRWTTGGKP